MEPDALPSAVDSASPHAETWPWKQCLWLGLASAYMLVSGWPVSIAVVTLGALVFADAWMTGIRRVPNDRSFLNISPLASGVAVNLLFIVAFPLYLLNRDRLGTRKGNAVIWGLIIVMGGGFMLWMLAWILSALGFLGRR